MQVVPAILTSDINSFWEQINKLFPYYNYFQIDIMDGTYGENKTISLFDIKQTLNKHQDLLQKIKFDFQLITKKPENFYGIINDLKKRININCVYFHYKTSLDIDLLYGKLGIEIGIAIDPDDSIAEFLEKYDIKTIKNIIIMTVFPRAQGQEFLEYPLNKIEQLRNAGYRYNISIDGGINDKTVSVILSKKFKPNFLNIGSFFSKAISVEENVKKINSIIRVS